MKELAGWFFSMWWALGRAEQSTATASLAQSPLQEPGNLTIQGKQEFCSSKSNSRKKIEFSLCYFYPGSDFEHCNKGLLI